MKLVSSGDPAVTHIFPFTTGPTILVRMDWRNGDYLNSTFSVDYVKGMIQQLQKAVDEYESTH